MSNMYVCREQGISCCMPNVWDAEGQRQAVTVTVDGLKICDVLPAWWYSKLLSVTYILYTVHMTYAYDMTYMTSFM